MFSWRKTDRIETLLGVGLPANGSNIEYYRWEPADFLTLYTVYIRFEVSEDDYLAWVAQLGLDLYRDGGEVYGYLPAPWDAEPELSLAWWRPTTETPETAAAKSYGENGWMMTKHENGVVYMMVTDIASGDDE